MKLPWLPRYASCARSLALEHATIHIVEMFNKGGNVGTVNFSVPDDVKDAFNAAFEGHNKSAVIAELMREAVERAARKERSRAAILRILKARPKAPVRSDRTLKSAREKYRI